MAKALVFGLLATLALAPAALASEPLSDVNVTHVRLAVDAKGEALLTYRRQDGSIRHVLVWGAVNALPPSQTAPQVRFRYDYADGWGRYHRQYWRTFRNACRPYTGPPLEALVTACTAPDGSFWAVQAWQKNLPLLGFKPWLAAQTAWVVEVSHWSGDLPQLQIGLHWTYGGSAVGIFGRLLYAGEPVHGFASTAQGNPLERYGRNVYIDTLNSAYGAGWARESGILLHNPTGTFCHSFVPQKPFPGYPSRDLRPAAPGDRYRVTVEGPGVTPLLQWEGPGLGEWTGAAAEQATQAQGVALFDLLMGGDRRCAPERA